MKKSFSTSCAVVDWEDTLFVEFFERTIFYM